jgi:hypothetical protein
MVYFQTKNPNLGKFWRALEWKIVVYFMTICNIFIVIWLNLWPFGIVSGHLVYFSHFGMFGPINLATLPAAVSTFSKL